MKENEWIICFHKYECVLGAYHCHKKKVLLALVSKRASEESSDSFCPLMEGTFSFVTIKREGGGVLGTARAGMVGKF